MSKALKERCFVEHEIQETLRNIVAASDPAYLQTVGPLEFEKGLIDEVRFLAPYDSEEMGKVEQYIHQHLNELYQLAHSRS